MCTGVVRHASELVLRACCAVCLCVRARDVEIRDPDRTHSRADGPGVEGSSPNAADDALAGMKPTLYVPNPIMGWRVSSLRKSTRSSFSSFPEAGPPPPRMLSAWDSTNDVWFTTTCYQVLASSVLQTYLAQVLTTESLHPTPLPKRGKISSPRRGKRIYRSYPKDNCQHKLGSQERCPLHLSEKKDLKKRYEITNGQRSKVKCFFEVRHCGCPSLNLSDADGRLISRQQARFGD